jgi:hypothetical protein
VVRQFGVWVVPLAGELFGEVFAEDAVLFH